MGDIVCSFDDAAHSLPASLHPELAPGSRLVAGRSGNALRLTGPATLKTPLSPAKGSISFWIRPSWSPFDNDRPLLAWGDGGGLLVARDGALNARIIVNRYAPTGFPERDASIHVPDWRNGQWHHMAASWSSSDLAVEVDGQAVVRKLDVPLFANHAPRLDLGNGTTDIDDLTLSRLPRTQTQMEDAYWSSVQVSALAISPLLPVPAPGWPIHPTVTANVGGVSVEVPDRMLTWSVAGSSISRQDDGLWTAAPGKSTLSVQFGGKQASIKLTVPKAAKAAREVTPIAELATPRPKAMWEVPFIVVNVIPTKDGKTVDAALTGHSGLISDLEAGCERNVRVRKWMMEEASRYHGYADANALPSLGYRCVRILNVYDVPPTAPFGDGNSHLDYNAIVRRLGGRDLVERQGVKEIWINSWHHGQIAPVESNMSSPITGDISNSSREEDLPVYEKSYTVYNFNFDRGPSLHNQGHQYESQLSYIAQRQDGNPDLWWLLFCGNGTNGFQPGRCGNTHFPPNGRYDYDYFNDNPFLSDCEDWRPDGKGTKKMISRTRWESIPYAIPTGDRIRQPGTILEDDAYYYIYWMQNYPGKKSTIPYRSGTVTNWWRFVGDWDGAIRDHAGLWKP